MSLRRLERLLPQIRRISDNEEFDNDPSNPLGIIDDEIVEYINDAKENLQARISEKHPKLFVAESYIDTVAGTEEYTLPTDLYMNTRLIEVAALFSSSAGDYTTLSPRSIRDRLPTTVTVNTPSGYIRRSNKILLQPKPDTSRTNGLRITYQQKLPRLDIRRGLVSSITGDLTSITLNTSPTLDRDGDLPTIAERTLETFDYITVVNSSGVVQAQGIPIDSYDSTTGIITVSSGHSLGSGESISAGDYVLGGTNSTTHSSLPTMCERYLVAYAAWKMLKRDSSVDLRDQERELRVMLDEIVDSYAEFDEDPAEFELDEDWFI